MPYTLAAHENKLYVVAEDTAFHTPMLRRLYYPVRYEGTAEQFARDYGAHRIGQELSYSRARDAYQDADGLVYALQEGGKTQPARVEEIPLACPKVRKGLETRYAQGRWEKRLRQGWMPA